MVLLTILAVGLLSLSAVQLRATGHGAAMAEARANARVSLLLALGDLQRSLGPDGRVSVTAEQSLAAGSGESNPHAQWTGVYEAWNADEGLTTRPQPEFVRWLTSAGDPAAARQKGFADGRDENEVPMVAGGTLGAKAAGEVTSPALSLQSGQQGGKLAWWVADESMKAHVVSGTERPEFARAGKAEPLFAANAGISANSAGLAALGEIAVDDPERSKFLSTAQYELRNAEASSLFHDVTSYSRGLPVDVTRGRFKFDFSSFSLLERRQVTNLPLYKADGEVNRFASAATTGIANDKKFNAFNSGSAAMLNLTGDPAQQPGIHLEELWTHANVYRNLTWTNGTPSLRLMNGSESNSNDFRHKAMGDPWFSYKKPVFAAVQFVFSFVSQPDPAAQGKFRMLLQMDALVKVWNPNNVRVEIPAGSSFAVQLLAVPFKVQWSITNPQGAPVQLPQSGVGNNTYAFSYGPWGSSGNKYGQRNFNWLRGNLGGLAQKGVSTGYTLEPGECKIFGHDKDTRTSDWNGDPNVNLSPGWGPGRQALIVADFGANGLGPDDSVEFIVSPDKDPNPSSGVRTYCNKWIGLRAAGSQASGGNGGLALGGNSLPTSINFDQPDPAWFPVVRSSQRLKVSQYATPKPFMIFGHYMNVEQSSAGTRDAFASSPRLLTNPVITTRRLRSFEPDQLATFQEVWRCDPLPMAYDSVLIDISAKDQGRFGGGHSALTGVTRCATRQLDAAPPLSLMSLSHAIANGFADRFGQAPERYAKGLDGLQSDGQNGAFKFEPGDIAFSTVTYAAPQVDRAIGNSFASPFIRANRVTGSGPYHAANGNQPLFDHSYLANAALFDSWFCSSLHDGGKFPAGAPYKDNRNAPAVLGEFFDGALADPAKRLINPRVIPASSATVAKERLLKGQALHPEAIARLGAHVFLDGAFNVNSTRKEAWQALLSTARDQAKLLNGNPVSRDGRTPFGASGLVTAAAAAPASSPTELEQWNGFRDLDDQGIAQLAEEIVKQVKSRGPFLSLADFINRRPGDSGEARLLGTVQAAIEAAGLNSALKGGGRGVTAADFAKLPAPEAAGAGGGLARSAGIPGYLMQSDVLATVANELTARGDSFRIRGYGAATDGEGRVVAEAWCEAIVQRMPDYLDAADAAETEAVALTSEANKRFGRRFEIISFQWLPRQAV